jgi:hypothetical protein
MKEEELMMKHSIHNEIYISRNKHKNKKNITTKVDNGVRQYRLRLWAFVSVDEAFLFIFKDSNVHHKSAKRVTKLPGCVLLYIKNPSQLTAVSCHVLYDCTDLATFIPCQLSCTDVPHVTLAVVPHVTK